MDLVLSDIVAEYRKYSEDHPLRWMSNLCIDKDGTIMKDSIGKYSWALNSISAVSGCLQTLARLDEKAYSDMVRNKLKAKNKKSFDMHGLISAFCELSVMNTFICRSSDPESFRYEDHVKEGSSNNVEFSINMSDFVFHVEVKTPNLILEDKEIAELLKENPAVLITDAQTENYEEIIANTVLPVRGSLARKLVDFLKSANKKFGKTNDEKEINLLVICWDDRVHLPLMALKSPKAQGVLTEKSFIIDEQGNPLKYDNVDCVLVNGNYALFKEYVTGMLFQKFRPKFPVNPFFQVFTYNFIIDHNLTESRTNMIKSIIQQDATVVDEAYADKLKPVSIATMKDDFTIKFS